MIYWIRKEVSFRKMEKLVKLAQYAKAHLLLEDLLILRPTDHEVMMQKAWVFLEERRFEDVLNWIQERANPDPDPVLLMLKGEALYHLGRLDEAKEVLTRSIALSPDNLRTEYTLALVHVAQHDFTSAAKWFENSIKYDKSLVQSRLLAMAEHYLHFQKFGKV